MANLKLFFPLRFAFLNVVCGAGNMRLLEIINAALRAWPYIVLFSFYFLDYLVLLQLDMFCHVS